MVILKRLRWSRLFKFFFTRQKYASDADDSKCARMLRPWRVECRVARINWVHTRDPTVMQTSISPKKFFYGQIGGVPNALNFHPKLCVCMMSIANFYKTVDVAPSHPHTR